MKIARLIGFWGLFGTALFGCNGTIGGDEASGSNVGGGVVGGSNGAATGASGSATGASGAGATGTSASATGTTTATTASTGTGVSGTTDSTSATATGTTAGTTDASTTGTTGYATASSGSSGGTTWTTPISAFSALRKIKGALTGLGPTDAEVSMATGPDALKGLIDTWMATPQFQDKMIFFFGNTFQQSSTAILDFEFQLRKRPGAFDLAYDIFGDTAFPMLFKNMQESFARTALELISEGKPFTDVLTTNRIMMTTALKSLYMQIEMPYDIHTQNYQYNQGTRPAIADTLNPSSPSYLVFGYAAPTTTSGRKFSGTCAGDSTKVSVFPGNTYLFQMLLGSVPRDSGTNSAGTSLLGCMEHAAQPYFTAQDLSDWQMVTITSGTPLLAYDLPSLRASAGTLPSKLQRISFFTTPAFYSVWNTNDSNQHRVTANQALLAALGEGFTSADANIPTPPTVTAVDGQHAVTTSVCYSCHKSLDPMKQFWGNAFDFNDRGDGKKSSGAASFGFGDVTQNGTTLADFGKFLGTVTDSQDATTPVNRFALALTQKLCFLANSTKCEETDPEMRRVALAFQNSTFNFKTLVRELFSSPLVTNAATTATFQTDGVIVSIARRDQLCSALSNRLGVADLCEIAMPTPTGVTTAANRLAGAISADAFSRGTEFPVTAPDPNLFYRAASELVCEAVAAKVVDATTGSVYSSSTWQTAIEDMVTRVMGVPSSDPKHAGSVQALTDHYNAAIMSKATATSSLRSTFSAACQSPTTLSFGI